MNVNVTLGTTIHLHYLALPYIALPYLALPCLTLPYLALPCLTLALPCLTLPYLQPDVPATERVARWRVGTPVVVDVQAARACLIAGGTLTRCGHVDGCCPHIAHTTATRTAAVQRGSHGALGWGPLSCPRTEGLERRSFGGAAATASFGGAAANGPSSRPCGAAANGPSSRPCADTILE